MCIAFCSAAQPFVFSVIDNDVLQSVQFFWVPATGPYTGANLPTRVNGKLIQKEIECGSLVLLFCIGFQCFQYLCPEEMAVQKTAADKRRCMGMNTSLFYNTEGFSARVASKICRPSACPSWLAFLSVSHQTVLVLCCLPFQLLPIQGWNSCWHLDLNLLGQMWTSTFNTAISQLIALCSLYGVGREVGAMGCSWIYVST